MKVRVVASARSGSLALRILCVTAPRFCPCEFRDTHHNVPSPMLAIPPEREVQLSKVDRLNPGHTVH